MNYLRKLWQSVVDWYLPIKVRKFLVPGNWDGVPSNDITLQQVFDSWKMHKNPLSTVLIITECPVCSKSLMTFEGAYDNKLNRHMVWGKYCIDGHWTYLEPA